jgi:sulfur-oxidizing protein SoxY
MKRRNFIKNIGAGALILLTPFSSMAAWIEEAFATNDMKKAMNLVSINNPEESDLITFKTPEIAENGAIVPISVSTTLPNVNSISIFVEKNPTPLTSQFEITEDMKPSVSVRIRMGETSPVIAVVTSNGKAYKKTNQVKVTIGGCGG